MLKLRQDKTFIKDLQKARLGDSQLGKFTAFITALMRGESLPPEARDHALVGEWQGYRDFHIGGDKLVIYKIKADELLHLTALSLGNFPKRHFANFVRMNYMFYPHSFARSIPKIHSRYNASSIFALKNSCLV